METLTKLYNELHQAQDWEKILTHSRESVGDASSSCLAACSTFTSAEPRLAEGGSKVNETQAARQIEELAARGVLRYINSSKNCPS